jgi:hypothetical protein
VKFPFTRDRIVLSSGIDDRERRVLLTALFHLRIAHAEDAELGDEIRGLVARLGGDYEAVFFGGFDRAEDQRVRPVPEYPADETDEA